MSTSRARDHFGTQSPRGSGTEKFRSAMLNLLALLLLVMGQEGGRT
jgi:hypothetical protein